MSPRVSPVFAQVVHALLDGRVCHHRRRFHRFVLTCSFPSGDVETLGRSSGANVVFVVQWPG